MTDKTHTQAVLVPIWFWIVGGIALLWNLLGFMAFVAQMMMTEEALSTLPDAQQEIYRNIPVWVTICFAIAVICGVLGSILLLLRMRLAVPVLILSLIGVLGQYGYMFFMTDTRSVMGTGAMVLPSVVVLVAIGLVPYTLDCKNRGYLK